MGQFIDHDITFDQTSPRRSVASAVVTRVGDGHTSYYTSGCARILVDGFLGRPVAPPTQVCTG